MINGREMTKEENEQQGPAGNEKNDRVYENNSPESNVQRGKNPQQADLNQLSMLASAFLPLAQQYVDLQKSKLENAVKRDEKAGIHNRKLTMSLLIFLGLVIVAMAVLTFFGKVSGDALLFLVGIIVGYLMNMIRGLLYSPWETDTEE